MRQDSSNEKSRGPLKRLEDMCSIVGRLLKVWLVFEVCAAVVLIVTFFSAVASALFGSSVLGVARGLVDWPNLVHKVAKVVLMIPVLYLGQRLCERVPSPTGPFAASHAWDLWRIGVLLLFLGFAPGTLGVLASFITWGTGNTLPEVFNGAVFMAGLVVIAVSRVFEYGCVLQERNDEKTQ